MSGIIRAGARSAMRQPAAREIAWQGRTGSACLRPGSPQGHSGPVYVVLDGNIVGEAQVDGLERIETVRDGAPTAVAP